MPRDNSTNPWVDPANQAVGAMYKYYMSQPTATDRAKLELQQMQLQEMQQKTPLEMDKLRIDNQLNQRMYDAGVYPGMPAPIQNFNFRQNNTSGEATQVFDAIMNPPKNLNLGDREVVQSGVTGLPIQEYGVGIAPRTEFDKETGQTYVIPAVPATNRPTTPITNMFGQFSGEVDDPMAASQGAIAQRTSEIGANQYQTPPIGSLDAGDVQPVTNDLGVTQMEWEDVLKSIDALPVPVDPSAEPSGQPVQQPIQPAQQPVTSAPNANTASIIQMPGSSGNVKQDSARAIVTNYVNKMAGAFNKLNESGDSVSSKNKGFTENLPNYMASTTGGQLVARAIGTEAQTQRDIINNLKPAILGAIVQATGQSAKSLDSNAELKFYLNTMSDTTQSIETSKAAMQVINDSFGLGREKFSNPAEVAKLKAKFAETMAAQPKTSTPTGAPDFDNMSEEELDRFISEQNGR